MEPDIFWIPKKGISVKKIEKWQNWTKITNRRKKRRTRYNGDNKEKTEIVFWKKLIPRENLRKEYSTANRKHT